MTTTTLPQDELRFLALRRLHEVITNFQRASGFGLRAYGKGVTPALKSHTLTFLACEGIAREDALVRALRVPQPTVSRVLKQLEREGFIKTQRSLKDRRHLEVLWTDKGVREYLQLHASMWTLYEDMLLEFSVEEREELFNLQSQFADSLGAAPLAARDDVYEMHQRVVRITWGLNLLRSDQFRRFKISILSWHLLVNIVNQPDGITARRLCEIFRAPKNTLASALNPLHERGVIRALSSSIDKRNKLLFITPDGAELLRQISDDQISMLADALVCMELKPLQRLVELSEAYLSKAPKESTEALLSARLALRRLDTPKEMARARCILESDTKTFQQQQAASEGGEVVYVGLYRERTLAGVAEVSLMNGRTWTSRCVIFHQDIPADTVAEMPAKACAIVGPPLV
jgi:DNA-binding MarR family transcriptional regulator